MKRKFRPFRLFTLVPAFGFILPGLQAQPEYVSQFENTTTEPGRVLALEAIVTTPGGNIRTFQLYEGEYPDQSNPVPYLSVPNGTSIRIVTPQLQESVQYWSRICNDFGCADSQTVTITVVGGDPGLFDDAAELGDGWVLSDWLGSVNLNFDPWLFHAEHGWLFLATGSTPENVFLFDLSTESWFWTKAITYPNMYYFGSNAWVFYFEGSTGPRNFVNLESGEFFNLD